MVHFFAASAYRRLALQRIHKLSTKLSEETRAEIAETLANERFSTDIDEMFQREEAIAFKQHGTLQATIMKWSTKASRQQAIDKSKNLYEEMERLYDKAVQSLSN